MLYCVIFCCIVLYCVVLCCILLYFVVLCCIVLYFVVLCCIALYCVVLCCIVMYCVVLCCIVLYCVVLCFIVLYCVVLCCIVLYCVVLFCIVNFVLDFPSHFSTFSNTDLGARYGRRSVNRRPAWSCESFWKSEPRGTCRHSASRSARLCASHVSCGHLNSLKLSTK